MAAVFGILILVSFIGCSKDKYAEWPGYKEYKECVACKESDIKFWAEVCKHCGEDPDGPDGAFLRVSRRESQQEWLKEQEKLDSKPWHTSDEALSWIFCMLIVILSIAGLKVFDKFRIGGKIKEIKAQAEQGNPKAEFMLGMMYREGDKVPKNEMEAANWLSKAADKGHPDAQNILGVLYANGDGVVADQSEAIKWYRKAANQGHSASQFNLGDKFCYGEGTPEDYVSAYAWYYVADLNGFPNAQRTINLIAEEMSKPEIRQAKELVKEMMNKNPKLLNK